MALATTTRRFAATAAAARCQARAQLGGQERWWVAVGPGRSTRSTLCAAAATRAMLILEHGHPGDRPRSTADGEADDGGDDEGDDGGGARAGGGRGGRLRHHRDRDATSLRRCTAQPTPTSSSPPGEWQRARRRVGRAARLLPHPSLLRSESDLDANGIGGPRPRRTAQGATAATAAASTATTSHRRRIAAAAAVGRVVLGSVGSGGGVTDSDSRAAVRSAALRHGCERHGVSCRRRGARCGAIDGRASIGRTLPPEVLSDAPSLYTIEAAARAIAIDGAWQGGAPKPPAAGSRSSSRSDALEQPLGGST